MVEFDKRAAQEALKKANAEKQFEAERRKAQEELEWEEKKKTVRNLFSKWQNFIVKNHYSGIELEPRYRDVPHLNNENIDILKIRDLNSYYRTSYYLYLWVNEDTIRFHQSYYDDNINIIYYPSYGIMYASKSSRYLYTKDEKVGTDQNYYLGKIIERIDITRSVSKSGGCYIATSIYGCSDCPEVWVLRRYRDTILQQRFLGRLFVRSYYGISPTLVKCFGETKFFKSFWRAILDKKVKALKSKGISDLNYDD